MCFDAITLKLLTVLYMHILIQAGTQTSKFPGLRGYLMKLDQTAVVSKLNSVHVVCGGVGIVMAFFKGRTTVPGQRCRYTNKATA